MANRKGRLRIKFIALFGGIALLPFIVAALIATVHLWNMQRDSAIDLNLRIAKTAADEIKNFIASQFETLKDLGVTYPDFTKDLKIQETLTERILYGNNYFIELAVVDSSGKETSREHIVEVVRPEDLIDRSGSAEFLATRKNGFYMSPIMLPSKPILGQSDVWNWPFLIIGREIRGADGTFRGAVFARVDARILQSIVHKISEDKEGMRAYMINAKGTVIAHQDFSQVLAEKSLLSIPVVATAVRHPEEIQSLGRYRNELGDQVLGAALPLKITFSDITDVQLEPDWILVVEQLAFVAFRPVYRMIFLITAIFAATLLLAAVLAILFAGRIASPIEQLYLAAKKFAAGDLEYRVTVKTEDEIQDLAQGFNAMAEALNKSISTISAERNKLALVLSGITDAVVAVDTRHRVITFNKTAEDIAGISARRALGEPVGRVFKLFEGDRELPVAEYCPLQPVVSDKIVFIRNNIKMIGCSKKEHFVNLVVGQIEGGGKIHLGYILTLHDISREEAIEKLKSEFITIAAHQLRTPLSGIKWALKMLLEEDFGKDTEKQKDVIRKTYSANDRLIAIVNDLLNASRIEEGKFGFQFQNIKPGDILAKLIPSYIALAKKKNIALVYKVESDMPEIKADPEKLAIVFENLINNAINYTTQGEVRVYLGFDAAKHTVLFSVTDTGMGISEEEQKKIFQKFYRGSTALQLQTEGTGLGLFIAKNIVEAHNGKIWFESKIGRGTVFYVTLPLTDA